MVSKALRDMSFFSPGHPQMMKEDILPALVRLAKVENAEIKQDVAAALCRLSASVELAFDMIDEGLPEALYWLTLEDLLSLNKSVFVRCSVVCRNVVVSDDALRRLSSESSRFSKVLERLSGKSDPELLLNVAMVCLRITGLRESMLAFHRGGYRLYAHQSRNGFNVNYHKTGPEAAVEYVFSPSRPNCITSVLNKRRAMQSDTSSEDRGHL